MIASPPVALNCTGFQGRARRVCVELNNKGQAYRKQFLDGGNQCDEGESRQTLNPDGHRRHLPSKPMKREQTLTEAADDARGMRWMNLSGRGRATRADRGWPG